MKEGMKRGELFPLFVVSAELTFGMRALLTKVVELMPSAYEMEELHAFKGAEGDNTVEIHAKDDAPFCALVFKTQSEPHVGDVSFFRILSGMVVNGQEVYNATRNVVEKLGHLSVAQGRGVPATAACVVRQHGQGARAGTRGIHLGRLCERRKLPAGAQGGWTVLQPGDHLGQTTPRAHAEGLHGRA